MLFDLCLSPVLSVLVQISACLYTSYVHECRIFHKCHLDRVSSVDRRPQTRPMIMRTYETPIGVMVTQLFKLAIVLMKTNANNSYVYGGGVSHTRSDLEPQTTNVKRPTDYVGVRAFERTSPTINPRLGH